MGIVTGYICLVSALLLMLKFIARILHWNYLNRCLMKIHRYVGFAFIAVSLVHLLLVLPVLRMRMAVITVSGILALVIGAMLIILCEFMKNRKKELKFHRVFSAVILCMAVIHVVFYYIDFGMYKTNINSIVVEDVNMSEISDGVYTGEYDAGYIYALVEVTVKDHIITDIRILEHRNERGSGAETIVNSIVSEQNLEVDAIAGATNSSKVINKACENALRGD